MAGVDATVAALIGLCAGVAVSLVCSRAIAAGEGVRDAMAARRRSDKRFRTIFAQATAPHFLVTGSEVTECNEAAVRVLGMKHKTDLIGKDVATFWPEWQPDGRRTEDVALEMAESARRGEVVREELIKLDAQGEELPVEVSMTAVSLGDEESLLVVWNDLRAARTAQARLRKSESKYRELVENLHQIIYQTDVAGSLVYVNPAWQRVTGFTVEGTIGEHFSNFVAKEDLPKIEKQHKLEIAGDVDVVQFEVRLLSRSGYWRYVEGTCRPLRDEHGEVVGTTGMLSDETEWLQAQEDLVAAKNAAEAADRAKGEFLAVMSHEIRTPLNGVLGFASLLRETPLDEMQGEYLRTISGCGDSLLTLIDDILDFSRMESGRFEMEELPFHLRDCAEGVIDIHAHRTNEKDVELVVDLADDLPEQVMGDVIRMKQVLSNLIGNAVKFTDAGYVRLIGWVAERSGEDVTLGFRVEDSGCGIPADEIEKLFRPFVQVDASTSRRYGGTGLGLAICRRLAEAMGGSIRVESELGAGTQVEFLCRTREVESAAPSPRWSGKRVVVADPSDVARRSLCERLERGGASVIECKGVESALAAVAASSLEEPVDLLAVGSAMADADGEPGAVLVARAAKERGVPVMVISPLTGARAEFLRDLPGECCRLAKPIHAASLRTALDRTFGAGYECGEETGGTNGATAANNAEARSDLAILLVEDNPVNTKLMLRMLGLLGYEPDHAGDGEACLRLCERRNYDVVLMDVQLPGMDGMAATRRLRELGCSSSVIALTAHAMPEDRERCLASGMNDYLTKPVQLARLREVLGELAVA